jgi:transposase-like protein
MYVQGVSTRKVAEITEQLCGTRFSKSQVSTLAGRLDSELAAWRERPLTAPSYPYVWVDARYEHVRVDGRVISQGVLLVTGLRGDDGRREILGVAVADTESEATYQELFRSLKARGLCGVRLVISDDHAVLRQAITRHFQGAGWQRCQVHFTRNLCGQVAATKRASLAAGLRSVFSAPTWSEARAAARRLAETWQASHPQVAERLEEELEACLACLAFPAEHRVRIRTINGLERLSQELKRRTRVVRIFPNRDACLRLVSALAMEQSDEWISGRRYLDVGLLTDEHREVLSPVLAAD